MKVKEESFFKEFSKNWCALKQEDKEAMRKKKIEEYSKYEFLLELLEKEVKDSVLFNYNDKERFISFLNKAKWHCIGKINWLENGKDAYKQD